MFGVISSLVGLVLGFLLASSSFMKTMSLNGLNEVVLNLFRAMVETIFSYILVYFIFEIVESFSI